MGLELARTIPRDREEYLNWLEEKRHELDVIIEETTNSEDYVDYGDDDEHIGLSRTRPQNSIMIEWTYIIDLDHEVFHGMWTPIRHL